MSTAGTSPTSAPSQTSELKRLATTPAVLCLMLFSAAYITNAMDRSIFSTLLPLISKTHGYGLKTGGFLATIFNLGIGFAGFPTGYLLDRWSRKSVLSLGMIIYSVATLLTVVAIGVADMGVYRAITGIGEGMQIAALYVAAGSYFYKNKAFVVGCINIGYGIGSVIGPRWGTHLALTAGSWKHPFVVFCILGLVMAAAVWFIIPRNFSEQRAISQAQDKSIVVENIPEIFFNRNIKLLMASVFVLGTVGYGYQGLYVSFLVRQLHFSQATAAAAFSFYGFGCMLPMLGGWLGDRFSNRGAVLTAYGAMAVITYLIFNVAKTPGEHYVLSFLQAFFYSSTLHVNHLALFQRSVRPGMVGRATGLFTSTHFISGAFAGYLLGALADKLGWGTAALIQESLLSICAIFVILAINPKLQLSVKQKLAGGH
ncbi:MAG: MFS transporter [Candidatus Korobacteraceae bacterium]